MSDIRPTYGDTIDLFETFETLWAGKWLVSAFVALAVLLGSGSILIKDPVFESKLIYSIDTPPPYYDTDNVLIDFQRKFYSISVFEEWKQNNTGTSLIFEDFSATTVIDGFTMSKPKDQQLAIFSSDEKDGSFILVKSSQLTILDDFFKYANHISAQLKDEYVVRAKRDLEIVEARLKDLDTENMNVLDALFSIGSYVSSAEKEVNVVIIQRPTMPEKVSPNVSLTLKVSFVLGGLIGALFVLVRNAITKRKEQLVKT